MRFYEFKSATVALRSHVYVSAGQVAANRRGGSDAVAGCQSVHSMSLKMTGQMDWQDYATYSQYHPDNLKKPPLVFADHVKAPAPLATLTEIDKKVFGAWGHALCCEPAYGKNETCTRLKERVTPKVGQTWDKVIRIERGKSISQTAMYGGSLREMSFEEIVEARGKKG